MSKVIPNHTFRNRLRRTIGIGSLALSFFSLIVFGTTHLLRIQHLSAGHRCSLVDGTFAWMALAKNKSEFEFPGDRRNYGWHFVRSSKRIGIRPGVSFTLIPRIFIREPTIYWGEDPLSKKVVGLKGYVYSFRIDDLFWITYIGSLLMLPELSALANRLLRRYPRTSCQNCGYMLRGNQSGICPECGEPAEKIEADL